MKLLGEQEIKDFMAIRDYESAISCFDLWCKSDMEHYLGDLEYSLREYCESYCETRAKLDKALYDMGVRAND